MGRAEGRLSRLYHALRTSVILWFAGVTDALCVWRCVEFFVHDPQILKKTGQCFGLNGVIFLGSILLWDYGLAPGMAWLLAGSEAWVGERGAGALLAGLQALFALLWLLPVYCISFALSCVWYQEIAELAMRWMRAQAGQPVAARGAQRPGGPIMEQMAQEVYRVVLYAVFYAQVSLLAYIPYVGAAAYFVLVSWLYALYSFDYAWSLQRQRLPQRIALFQTHSAFFLGFGCVCTAGTCALPFFAQAAVAAMAYPLFILVAAKSDPLAAYRRVAEAERAAGRQLGTMQLPIFWAATTTTGLILSNFLAALQLPGALLRNRGWLLMAAGLMAMTAAAWALRQQF